MFPTVMSNSTSLTQDSTISRVHHQADFATLNSMLQNSANNLPQQPPKIKKKRNLPGNPDPDAEVIALSPKTLLATNRFVCEICNKGFQRDQNLQLHRRGHNLPWKLKQRSSKENRKRAYVCPEPTCLHHHPSRALGDLTGIKKHYCRKHGEKKWKCEKCSKIYAVQSDWKAHSKTCGTREYRCDCGTLFSRKDSFITHRAFCDALAEESARLSAATHSIFAPNPNNINTNTHFNFNPQNHLQPPPSLLPFSANHHHHHPNWDPPSSQNPNPINSHINNQSFHNNIKHEITLHNINHHPLNNISYQDHRTTLMTSPFGHLHIGNASAQLPPLSATALLQKAATVGPTTVAHLDMRRHVAAAPEWRKEDVDDRFTRDFLGLTGGNGNGNENVRQMLTYAGGAAKFSPYDHEFGFTTTTTEACSGWGN